mgnify:CR=1 FL=1
MKEKSTETLSVLTLFLGLSTFFILVLMCISEIRNGFGIERIKYFKGPILAIIALSTMCLITGGMENSTKQLDKFINMTGILFAIVTNIALIFILAN